MGSPIGHRMTGLVFNASAKSKLFCCFLNRRGATTIEGFPSQLEQPRRPCDLKKTK